MVLPRVHFYPLKLTLCTLISFVYKLVRICHNILVRNRWYEPENKEVVAAGDNDLIAGCLK